MQLKAPLSPPSAPLLPSHLTPEERLSLIRSSFTQEEEKIDIQAWKNQTADVGKCTECGKVLLESVLASHIEKCKLVPEVQKHAPSMKRQLSEAASDSSVSPTKKTKSGSLVVVLGDADKKKKIKLAPTTGLSGADKKSIPSTSKDKDKKRQEVDVDRHCGVQTDKGPCLRSLTCKTHSMGAKRSVPNRSASYDILLHEWLKASKPELANRKPVQPRVGPGSEAWNNERGLASDPLIGESSGKKKKNKSGVNGVDGKKEKREKSKTLIVGEYEDSEEDNGGMVEAMVDSEDETDAVMRGLARVPRGRPLGVPGMGGGGAGFASKSFFLGRNLKLARLRDSLTGVFAPQMPIVNASSS